MLVASLDADGCWPTILSPLRFFSIPWFPTTLLCTLFRVCLFCHVCYVAANLYYCKEPEMRLDASMKMLDLVAYVVQNGSTVSAF